MKSKSFAWALGQLKEGNRVLRTGWNGKEMFLYLASCKLPFPPLLNNKSRIDTAFNSSTFIVMKTADNKLIPWLASQTDILAGDWEIGG